MDISQYFLYAAGLLVTFAFDDLSFQALASQSPKFPSLVSSNLYDASNAVDRKTATCMRTDDIGFQSPHRSTWWKVDLGGKYSIYSIHILFKNYDSFEYRQRGRFAGFSIYVSNTGDIEGSTLCYKDGPNLPPLNFTTTCTEYGRYIIFYNERQEGVVYPDGYQLSLGYTELCEVIVKGCKRSNVYGTACDIPCPIACKNNTCHIQNGGCFGCEPEVYGSYCNLSCPPNSNDNKCHGENGTCFTCEPGLAGIYCITRCKRSSVYGTGCDIPCSVACKDSTCHIPSGGCFGCESGVYGSYCNLSCPADCKDNRCHEKNGTCFTCKPGWTGIYCITKCTDGWYGVNCSRQCSGHCRDGTTCNHVTGQCERGCDKGWTGSLCRKECDDGTYGYDCVNNCSGHCLNDSPCNKQTGDCDGGCNLGYTNKDCSKKCSPGHFGVTCSERCSDHCIDNEPCYHVSGVCFGGCQDGYYGDRCFNTCTIGYYGKNCSLTCSQSCNGTCAHVDGSCKDCKDGRESHCSKERFVLNQNVTSSTSWIIACIVSLVFNCVFISGACLLCRGIYTKKVSISRDLLSQSKRSIYYTDTELDVKTSEHSTYQELDLSKEEIQYQNTTIR